MKSYMPLIADYFFSSKRVEDYNKHEQITLELAIDILTTHGVGGKFTESLIRHRFNMKDVDSIHGWDAKKNSRPVEIKTETINVSKRLSCEGSFGDHREGSVRKSDLFKSERPLLYSVGIDDVSGKCLYVMETDTKKCSLSCLLFERLNARAPRISFAHWKDQHNSYKIVYKNAKLILDKSDRIKKNLLFVLK
jgi:hypothetical protein